MNEESFIPLNYQSPIDLEQAILREQSPTDEKVEVDVLFVGAGPAGLAGAIELARLAKSDRAFEGLKIAVLEKAENVGGHCLSGAIIDPRALRELFPESADRDFPFREPVKDDQVYILSEKGRLKIPTPPTMHNRGNFVASICEVVRWLAAKAEESGVDIFTSFPAASLLVKEQIVRGVRTVAAGLDREGKPTGQYLPPTDVEAKVTILAEGTRGHLTQAYCQWQKITAARPQIYALGVKELWRSRQVPEAVIHTLGWPLPKNVFGGSWLYPMGEDLISLGLVVGLDYPPSRLDVHALLQKLKCHPLFQRYLSGGECVEWGAKTIPEGGFAALPSRLHGDGVLLTGDAAGLVNVPRLKGIHYAMQSGIYAARTVFAALKQDDFSARTLSAYDRLLLDSYVGEELYRVRNMRHAFKSGFYLGGLQAGLMTVSGGKIPGLKKQDFVEDAAERKFVSRQEETPGGLSKVDAVYLSGNKTRDDIPVHLKAAKPLPSEVIRFYTHLCPANVYEWRDGELAINAPNCVDCKATDVLGPRWTPREGGSGPDYKLM